MHEHNYEKIFHWLEEQGKSLEKVRVCHDIWCTSLYQPPQPCNCLPDLFLIEGDQEKILTYPRNLILK